MLTKTKVLGTSLLIFSFLIVITAVSAYPDVIIQQKVELPLYGATQRTGDPFAYQELLNELRLLRQEVKSIRANTSSGVTAEAPWANLYGNKCSTCHSRSTAGQGGGFVLLEDNGLPAQITAKQMLKVVYRTYSGEMPPNRNKVTSDEYKLVMSHAQLVGRESQ